MYITLLAKCIPVSYIPVFLNGDTNTFNASILIRVPFQIYISINVSTLCNAMYFYVSHYERREFHTINFIRVQERC